MGQLFSDHEFLTIIPQNRWRWPVYREYPEFLSCSRATQLWLSHVSTSRSFPNTWSPQGDHPLCRQWLIIARSRGVDQRWGQWGVCVCSSLLPSSLPPSFPSFFPPSLLPSIICFSFWTIWLLKISIADCLLQVFYLCNQVTFYSLVEKIWGKKQFPSAIQIFVE